MNTKVFQIFSGKNQSCVIKIVMKISEWRTNRLQTIGSSAAVVIVNLKLIAFLCSVNVYVEGQNLCGSI